MNSSFLDVVTTSKPRKLSGNPPTLLFRFETSATSPQLDPVDLPRID
jgi:hypothetical protein